MSAMRTRIVWVVGGLAGLAVLVSAGTFVYIHFIEGPAPARLTFTNTDATTTTSSTGPTVAASSAPTAAGSGTWRPTSDSKVGYRVKEVLFGQNAEAVGRTNKVSGTLTINGSTVSGVDLTVDMTSVASDQSRRDGQFRGRIMDVSSFPTATFKLTQPLTLPNTASGGTVSVSATGQLTLRGTTKAVTVPLQARQNGAHIEVNGTIPITFAQWGIPSPSFGPATTEDHGVLELLVVFEKAS
jgi:polyisoprenoid-binding protein YceI